MQLRHVDQTWDRRRTKEELRHIGYSVDEVNAVIPGYPALDARLYVPEDEPIPFEHAVILGREVRIFDIPGGHDATVCPDRAETLKNMNPADLLLGTPDPDLVTGGQEYLTENDPSVRRAIKAGCRDFTRQLQGLLPGWKQLLSLRTADDRPLGMPTGIGWFAHLGLSLMVDGTAFRLSQGNDDLEVLLYNRPANEQSESVWATPGGFAIKADTQHEGMTPLQAASARRAEDWTERNLWGYPGVALQAKYPVSSGTTIVAGLATKPYGRFIQNPDYNDEPTITPQNMHNMLTHQGHAAGYVSLRALCEDNPFGGVSGKGHQRAFSMWTTHFEYVVSGTDALIDPENQYRFGMNGQQFDAVQNVVEGLRQQYPMLQPA